MGNSLVGLPASGQYTPKIEVGLGGVGIGFQDHPVASDSFVVSSASFQGDAEEILHLQHPRYLIYHDLHVFGGYIEST